MYLFYHNGFSNKIILNYLNRWYTLPKNIGLAMKHAAPMTNKKDFHKDLDSLPNLGMSQLTIVTS